MTVELAVSPLAGMRRGSKVDPSIDISLSCIATIPPRSSHAVMLNGHIDIRSESLEAAARGFGGYHTSILIAGEDHGIMEMFVTTEPPP